MRGPKGFGPFTDMRTQPLHAVSAKIANDEAIRGVIALAHHAGTRGWIPATSGNFSVRIDGTHAAVTASGSDKTKLTGDGVIVAEIAGAPHPRASAEAPLHLALYRVSPEIGAVA